MHDIFDKIIKREIPANIVYEDDLVLAFLDIRPVNHGHTLIIPKKKFVNIFDGDPEVLGHMMRVAQKISRVIEKELAVDGINLIMNNNEAARQEVWHAHLHVVPRLKDDNAYQDPTHVSPSAEEFLTVQEKIVEGLEELKKV